MEEKVVKRNSLKAWVLAARLKTLTGATVPVLIALSLAYKEMGVETFKPVPALLCLLFALVMQIDANFINDYFDFVRGNDNETRLGPKRACAEGWIGVKPMKWGILLTTLLACAIGTPLLFYAGMKMLLIGLLCVLFCFLYTTSLSYLGLGDLLVVLFFGLIPLCTTYYIQTGQVTLEAFLLSLACGFVIDTLLLVNNYRDIENDAKANKRTLVVRIGAANGLRAYLICGIIPLAISSYFLFSGRIFALLIPLIYLFSHIRTYRKMKRIERGKELNVILGETARNIFIYGLSLSVGILL